MSLKNAVQTLVKSGALPADDLKAALNEILSGEAEPVLVGALLTGLEMKGVDAADIRSGAEVLRAHMAEVPVQGRVMDTCGTGGDGLGTYNISTAAAIVASACGVRIAKHGNKSVSSKSGSSEVLASLGVNIDLTPHQVAACIEACGIGFLYAPRHHSAMRHVAPVRAAMGMKTLFNLLGPLSNPARASTQLLGVYDAKWCRPVTEALRDLGVTRAWVVHGSDGLDELTVTGPSHVCELHDGDITEFDVAPASAALSVSPLSELIGGDSDENAAAMSAVFKGKTGAYSDIIALNAGAAIYLYGEAESLKDGVAQAAQALQSGMAKKQLDLLISTSQSLANS